MLSNEACEAGLTTSVDVGLITKLPAAVMGKATAASSATTTPCSLSEEYGNARYACIEPGLSGSVSGIG